MNRQDKKRLLLAILVSLGFTAILLSRVKWEHFSIITGRLEMRHFVIAFGIFVSGNFVRTCRFQQFDHTGQSLARWWGINSFYNFITSTLPGGLGEAATAYILKRLSVLNILSAFRILLISRIMDAWALSSLLFVASIYISSGTLYREAAIWVAGMLFLLSSAALIPSSERFALRLLQRLPGHFAFIKKMSERLDELLSIAEDRQRAGFHLITLSQSVVAIIGGIATLHFLLRSFGIEFTTLQSIYCYGVYAVFQIIPVQGMAGIGTQAAWWAIALNAAGYKTEDSVALGFVLYGTFYMFIAFIGIISFVLWSKERKGGVQFSKN